MTSGPHTIQQTSMTRMTMMTIVSTITETHTLYTQPYRHMYTLMYIHVCVCVCYKYNMMSVTSHACNEAISRDNMLPKDVGKKQLN